MSILIISFVPSRHFEAEPDEEGDDINANDDDEDNDEEGRLLGQEVV